jgi:hypothetical protein
MDANNNNGFLIWTRIKDLFAQRTGLRLSQCLTQWHKIQYKGSLTNYLDQVEACLATFDSISYVQEGSAICGVITSTLSESQGSLTNPILTNNALMLDPVLLLTKIWDIAFNERTCNRPAAPEHSATAMATNSKTCSQGCCNKKHNPLVETHSKEKCWAIHPEKKDAYLSTHQHTTVASHPPAASTSQHQTPAFAAVTLAQCYITRAPASSTILDSGASHHMFNNLYFRSICCQLLAYVLFSGFVHMVIMLFLFFMYFH